EVPEAGPSCR
ncbi:hypothetical protein BN1708_018501, partial [Verticillium longisporum]